MTDASNVPSQDDSDPSPHIHLVLAMVFLAVVGGGAVDLVLDRPETLLSGHVLFELGMIGVSLGAAGYLGTRWYQAHSFARQLRRSVEASQAERDAWRQRAQRVLDGLGKVMSAQFESWGLTPTERETALMLLKATATSASASSRARASGPSGSTRSPYTGSLAWQGAPSWRGSSWEIWSFRRATRSRIRRSAKGPDERCPNQRARWLLRSPLPGPGDRHGETLKLHIHEQRRAVR